MTIKHLIFDLDNTLYPCTAKMDSGISQRMMQCVADFFNTTVQEAIKIREKKFGDYDLIMYPIHTKVKVLTNKDFTDKTLSRMMLVLDVVHGEKVARELEYIDIRGTNIVYKWKELENE